MISYFLYHIYIIICIYICIYVYIYYTYPCVSPLYLRICVVLTGFITHHFPLPDPVHRTSPRLSDSDPPTCQSDPRGRRENWGLIKTQQFDIFRYTQHKAYKIPKDIKTQYLGGLYPYVACKDIFRFIGDDHHPAGNPNR